MRCKILYLIGLLSFVINAQSSIDSLIYNVHKNDPYSLKNFIVGIIPINADVSRDSYVTLSPNLTFDYRKDSTFLFDMDLKIGVFDNTMAMQKEDNIEFNGGNGWNLPLIRYDAGTSYIMFRRDKAVKRPVTLSSSSSIDGKTTTYYRTKIRYNRKALYGLNFSLGFFHNRANVEGIIDNLIGDDLYNYDDDSEPHPYDSYLVKDLSHNYDVYNSISFNGKGRSSLSFFYTKIGLTQLLLHQVNASISEYGERSISRTFKAHFNLLFGFANKISDYIVRWEDDEYGNTVLRTNVFRVENNLFKPLGLEFGFVENGLGTMNNISLFFNGGFRPGYYSFGGNAFAEAGVLIILSRKL